MEKLKEHLAPFVIGVICCLVCFAIYNLVSAKLGPETVQFVQDTSQQEDVSSEVYVHVTGQVVSPGVYSLPSGSRVLDAVDSAGGFADDADRQAVNLAAYLVDAQKIYIPAVDEQVSVGATSLQEDGLIDLNTATEAELDQLPSIGPVTAGSIIQYRTENGPFSSCEELLDVPGIGDVTFSQIRDLVTVY